MPSCIHFFRDITVGDEDLSGTAEVRYSREWGGFTILDIGLDDDCLPTGDGYPHETLAAALMQQDRQRIEETIREDQERRDAEYREERGRPMMAAE